MSGVSIDSSAAPENRRQRLRWLFEMFRAHMRRRWVWWAVATIPLALLGGFCGISFNVVTDSLPHKAYLLLYFDRVPQRGQYYAFAFPGGGPYWPDAPFVKEFAGVPGDVVSTVGREVFVNGRSVGIAKERSRTGYPLAMVSPGVIPKGMYYVYAPNLDSLDSRYAMVGLIPGWRVIGRAVPLW
jgi:conjugal transfer pilin signal peptidase TrbI